MKKLFLFGLALFLLIFFVVPVYLGYGQEEPIVEWIARYNGPGNEEDSAYAIAVGPSGNVYVTGYSYGSGTDHDYATIRYDRDGNEVWVARYNGTGNDIDIAYAIAVGPSGNVYVTGRSYGIGTDFDYTTIKYDRDGNEVWVARYNGPGNKDDRARALAVDPSGNIYVTGSSDGIGISHDYATIKYDKDGNEVWVARYDGPGNYTDVSQVIAVGPSGNVYVSGYSEGIGTYLDYATIKYNRDGNEVWVARYNGPGDKDDRAWAISVDSIGNIYVTGNSPGIGTGTDYATIKYDRDGNEVWITRANGNSLELPYAITVNPSGNVYVTGYSGSGGWLGTDYTTIKYDRDGNEVWVARHNGPGNDCDIAGEMAVDPLGNIYVSGYSKGIGTDFDYATIKYDRDGNEVWVARYNGPGNYFDTARAIAVGPSGNVYVTGGSYGDGTNSDYATVKYSKKH